MLSEITIRNYSDPPRIRKLSLEVKRGELVLILGDPGSGKSRIVRCLAGIEKCGNCGLTLAGAAAGSISSRVSGFFVFQSDNFDPDREVVQQLIRRIELRGFNRHSAMKLVSEWAREYSLEAQIHRKAEELNLEEVGILALAPLMIWKPPVVVLDDPLGNMGATRQSNFSAYLRELRSSAAILVTASAPSVIHGIADRVVDLSETGFAE